jgi:hypothetical protein
VARHPIVVLWAVPRSASTAFERMMIERGDHHVVDEPFSAHYYFGAEKVSPRFDAVEPASRPTEILAALEAVAEHGPVFVKDMAYHVASFATPDLLGRFRNAFMIRDPLAATASLAARWPDFTDAEAGFDALDLLASMVDDPVVVDHDDLCRDPATVVATFCERVGIPFLPQALTWSAGMRPEWARWADWHAAVAASTGFVVGPPRHVDAGARVREVAELARPVYERLHSLRLR